MLIMSFGFISAEELRKKISDEENLWMVPRIKQKLMTITNENNRVFIPEIEYDKCPKDVINELIELGYEVKKSPFDDTALLIILPKSK